MKTPNVRPQTAKNQTIHNPNTAKCRAVFRGILVIARIFQNFFMKDQFFLHEILKSDARYDIIYCIFIGTIKKILSLKYFIVIFPEKPSTERITLLWIRKKD